MSQKHGWQNGEAFVLIKEENSRLRYRPDRMEPFKVRSHTDERHPELVVYEEDVDYIVDWERGYIRRTGESRIPDWSRHEMYGVPHFDHTKFTDCSNRKFTIYADYGYEKDDRPGMQSLRPGGIKSGLDRWKAKLQGGEETLFVVYGDSISAGGDASEEKFAYFRRFAQYMNELYPDSTIRLINKSMGGETSEGGRERVARDVAALQPDLITIGYGMNDQNLYENGVGVPLQDFIRNHRLMIETLLQLEGSDIVLVTPCLPNPLWKHTSGHIGQYADSIRRLGSEYGLGVADVHAVWELELAAGKTPESLLLNNINHPNDYGHQLYFQAFLNLLDYE